MSQVSSSMADTPTRMSAVICLLVLVWIVTYWLWEPLHGDGAPRVTFADDRAGAQRSAGPVAPVVGPPGPASPPAEAAGPTAPAQVRLAEAPRFTEYMVQSGDVSVEVISERVYGTRRHAAAILRANPFADPTRLVPGRTTLRIPADPTNVEGRVVTVAAEPGAPEPPPAAGEAESLRVVEYVITRDDTLWGIAKAYYGKGHLWSKIYEANRDVIADPDRPPVGRTIRIPPLDS